MNISMNDNSDACVFSEQWNSMGDDIDKNNLSSKE
jgi:hypothetical protein